MLLDQRIGSQLEGLLAGHSSDAFYAMSMCLSTPAYSDIFNVHGGPELCIWMVCPFDLLPRDKLNAWAARFARDLADL